jgi:uncharacterized repeat protein (TIGR01451 family)
MVGRLGYSRNSCSAGLAWLLLAVLFLAGSHQARAQSATVTATTGQSCAGTRFGSNLGCTANDFSSNLTFDQPSGSAIANCRQGTTVTIDVLAAVTSNAPERYDVAYFIGENSIDPALNNGSSSCSIGLFPTTPLPFKTVDTDSCGDFESNGVATLRINSVPILCSPVPGTNSLALPYVLVFSNNTGGNTCNVSNITASTKSKCLASTTASVTGVTVNGYVTVTKQTVPDTQPGSFSFTTSASPSVSVSPSTASLSDNGSQTFEVALNSGGTRTLTITETSLAGWDPTASITCTTPSGGSSAAYVTVNNAARTITANLTETNYGAVCTITNTKIPTVKVQKITRGGFDGPFTFAQTNLASAPGNITTTAASTATPASPTAIQVTTIGTAVTITETVDSDYVFNTATCTDANSARTGNTGSIGTVSGTTLTIPAARVTAGSDYTCVFTNDKRPILQLSALSNGGLGTFTFTGDNGFAGDSIATSSIGSAAAGTADQLDLPATATAITATVPAGWLLGGATCTGMGAGGTATLSSNVLTLNAAATAPGTSIACTFTYNKRPVVRVQKITTGGFGGPFSFATTNLDSAVADISTAAAGTATPASPGFHYVTSVASNVTLSESFSLAWITSGVTCTDANVAITGNPTPVATSTTASVTILAARNVYGADITCVYTNPAANPVLALSKTANVATVDDLGDLITYTLAVSNTGNVPLSSVTLTDALGSVVCPSSGTNVIATLIVGGSENCSFTYAASQSDFDSNGGGDGDIDNTASVLSVYNGSNVVASDSEAVALQLRATLTLVKSANPPVNVIAGSNITYTFYVKNTGNQTLAGISVSDSHNAYGAAVVPGSEIMFADAVPLADSADASANGSWDTLRPGDEIRFTGTYQVVQQDVDLLQ